MSDSIDISEQVWEVQQELAKYFSQTRPNPRIAAWACLATVADIISKLHGPAAGHQFTESNLKLMSKITGTEFAGLLIPAKTEFPDPTKTN